jgi:hypothetical protein
MTEDENKDTTTDDEQFKQAMAMIGVPGFVLTTPSLDTESVPETLADTQTEETLTQEVVPVIDPTPNPPPTNIPPKILPDVDPATPEDWVAFLNDVLIMVMNGGKMMILYEEFSTALNRVILVFSNQRQLSAFYAHKRAKDGEDKVPVFEHWFSHPNRKTYLSIEFAPGKKLPSDVYNLWRGYAYIPKQGDWSLLKGHILNIICSGNSVLFEYVMDWMADLIQLRDKPGVAIVIIGKKGTGKGVFVTCLGKLLGSHFTHLVHSHHLTGNFNTHLKDALLIFADEAVWGGNKQAESVLKGMITEELQMIEPKGVNCFAVKSYARIIIASNSDWVVPTSEDERRYLVLNVSDAERGHEEYFAAIIKQMGSGGYNAMLDELLNRDLTGKNLRNAPRTEALAQQIYQSDEVFQFLVDRLDSESLYSVNGSPITWGDGKVPTSTLLSEFRLFLKSKGKGNYMMPDNTFGKHLRKWLNMNDNEKDPVNCLKPAKVRINGRQVNHYVFKGIDACKQMIESNLKAPWNWASNADEDDT